MTTGEMDARARLHAQGSQLRRLAGADATSHRHRGHQGRHGMERFKCWNHGRRLKTPPMACPGLHFLWAPKAMLETGFAVFWHGSTQPPDLLLAATVGFDFLQGSRKDRRAAAGAWTLMFLLRNDAVGHATQFNADICGRPPVVPALCTSCWQKGHCAWHVATARRRRRGGFVAVGNWVSAPQSARGATSAVRRSWASRRRSLVSPL